MSKLTGKSVLITGAARGIGACTAEQFARAGCRMVLSDLDEGALQKTAGVLRGLGATVDTYVVDVADKAQVDAMASDVLQRLGALDILINNAGIGHHGSLAETTLEVWRKLVDVDLFGPLHHVYAFLPSMRERRAGHIVNVSSGQAFYRLPSWGAYAAIKVAVGVFSEILFYELAPLGIQVTTVYPYMVNTGFYSDVKPTTFAGRMSMRLLPYYSDSPEKVGRVIFEAVKKTKRIEMVSVLNDVGFYAHLVPPVASAVSRASSWLLNGDG